ncbi:hypothetical protein [Streptomyces sp. 891-h]|uniref:hypothetical protein n=1 Tax=Streptomyces sp. 891-h TaxID=2720714 RepID=UPI001FA97CD7|nr:hypothetical protein [Streptomyces sp. 891-h]UNZ20629.1 hypothetical protein HC362_29755 [Streptomyces sp. 891-h]
MIAKIDKCRNCGTPHEWVYDEPTLLELRRIKKMFGWTARGFQEAMVDGDPDAMACLLDLLHRRDGVEIPFDAIDVDFTGFDMIDDEEEKEAARLAEAAAGKPAAAPVDPTPILNGALSTVGSTDRSGTIPPAFGGTSA